MEPLSSGLGILALLSLVFLGIGILGTAFWIWMLAECATKERSEGNDKVVWTLIIIFTHLIGAALYFFLRRPQRRVEMASYVPSHDAPGAGS